MDITVPGITLPSLLSPRELTIFQCLTTHEIAFLEQAAKLFGDGYYDHALLDLWNAAVHNLRRRVESYSVEVFLSVIKDEAGRKKYDKDGETIADRWSGIDDLVLINGCSRLDLLSKKAAKALEMINWMRNHASPAHDSSSKVDKEDVVGLVLLLQKNLFEAPLPDAGHSVAGLFDPVKSQQLDATGLDLLRNQIETLRNIDIRTIFGFFLDGIVSGQKPAIDNIRFLFPHVWKRASDEIRKTAGMRYHTLTLEAGIESRQARDRLLEFLAVVDGIGYIPDAARAAIYRHAAKVLSKAKDSAYGWSDETSAARGLAQFGAHVPKIAFEEVYQEILAVWCGNYWGRSAASSILEPFIDSLETRELRQVVELFQSNERVRAELFQSKPKKRAIELLNRIKEKLPLEAHKTEVDKAIHTLP